MLIQKLLGPDIDICNEKEMYFHGVDGNIDLNTGICLESKKPLLLDTYFNSFSIGKWKKYTVVDDVYLHLDVEGDCDIRGFCCVGRGDQVVLTQMLDPMKEDCSPYIHSETRELPLEIKKVNDGYDVFFKESPDSGVVFVSVDAKTKAVFYGGGYYTHKEPTQVPYLGLGICTFKREDDLKRNVNNVLKSIINNPDSELYNRVEIYISDNGNTVNPSEFLSEKVFVYPNKNAGGAGGFTRTILEAVYNKTDSEITHMILMDDDIELYPEVLSRTYLLLSFMKNEYKDTMVGGEMFPLDLRYKQFEAGAKWNGPEMVFYNKGWDMRTRDAVAANEAENDIDYSGWWYSVIPVSTIKNNGLPIPLFIHYDDVEYGTRNKANGTILLNGICVWHPQGINKAPVRMTYYDIRNMLIGMANKEIRYPVNEVISSFKKRIIGATIRYRFTDAEIILEAVEDFCKGPKYFMTLEPVKKHGELESFNNVYLTPEEAHADMSLLHNERVLGNTKGKFLKALLLWLLPSTKEMRVVGSDDIGLAYSARKIFYYDETKEKGYIAQKDYGRAVKDVFRYMKVISYFRKNYNTIMDEWETMKPSYTGKEFWESYLELK